MIHVGQIHQIAAVAFEKAVLRGQLIFKEMEGIRGFQCTAGTQLKAYPFILSLHVFNLVEIELLVAEGCLQNQALRLLGKGLDAFVRVIFSFSGVTGFSR